MNSGSNRDDVIATFGEPKGSTRLGAKEILIYPNGRVWLENGRVVRCELPLNSGPAAATIPAGPATAAVSPVVVLKPAAKVSPVAVAPEAWLTDFAQAKAGAAAKRKRILALFTGSDWCPACQQFEGGVAHNVDFLRLTRISFVLLKLDYPQSTFQPPALREQNEELRRHYRINAYPTLLVMSADGGQTVKVDTSHSRPAADLADYFVQAVDEARRDFDRPKSSWWPF
ncbi:MAG: thioredoxin family protein [Opitutales bacterium]